MVPTFVIVTIVSMVTLWHPIATQDLEPINKLGLDPDAAHVCQKTTTESYTALESFNRYFTKKTNTWCLAFPPRCTQYLLASQVSYRIATHQRQRKEYYCCQGYKHKVNLKYCVPHCVEDCYESKGQGTCVLPGECVCNYGYRGQVCKSSCEEGTWGPDCTRSCTCSKHGSCSPENGNCICQIGYTGQDCSTPCRDSFGLNCVHPCVCENNSTCNNINGKCTCQSGFYGAYCHKTCETGSAPDTCQQVCQCQNGGTCDENQNCVCPPGYTGDYCTEECDSLHYGQDCSMNCSCYSGTCDHVTGQCYCQIGYAGVSCERQCKPGYYGYECSIKCPCKNGGRCYYGKNGLVECNCAGTGYNGTLCANRVCKETEHLQSGTENTCISCQCPWNFTESCDAKTGICDCKAGYRGYFCEETCSRPFWGKNCVSVCACSHGDCDIERGECQKCYAGFTGDDCDQPCPPNKYGSGCRFDCICENGADCHATTGYCNCTAGFYGKTCGDFCPENRYGPSCSNSCTCDTQKAICNPYSGQCQCKSGYFGAQCENSCEDGKYGFQCQHDCMCYKDGTNSCNPHTGECNCKPGWKGVTCNSRCPDAYWGEVCSQTCSCHPNGSCDPITGACVCLPGYTGENCEETCGSGYYGYNCEEPCPVCYEGTVCNFKTGECTAEECPPGLTGVGCQQECGYGTWGANCRERCNPTCLRNGYCNPYNGQCACLPGYSGDQCEQNCKSETFGHRCNSTCQCIPGNSADCHHIKGCVCRPGYTGDRCQYECPSGFWGPDCLLQCVDICSGQNSVGCHPQRGIPCLCKNGYTGCSCSVAVGVSVTEQRTGADPSGTSKGGMIGLAMVAAVLALAIIIVVLCFLRRQKRQEKLRNEMGVEYRSQNGPAPSTIPNNTAAGLVNPTYEAENIRNESRYPRLEQRASLQQPPPPPRRRCDDEFDDIVDAKLRVDLGPTSRPTTGHYDDVDESRYTTLGSVRGMSTNEEIVLPDRKLRPDSNKHTDYTFYLGNPGNQGRTPSQRSSRGSESGNRKYGNNQYDTNKSTNIRTVMSPLYDSNFTSHDNIIGQSDPEAFNSISTISSDESQSSIATEQSDHTVKPPRSMKEQLQSNQKQREATPCNQLSNPYDIPNKANGSPENIQPHDTFSGYITPLNEVNNPYENHIVGLTSRPSIDLDRNQNKLTASMYQSDTSTNSDRDILIENLIEISETNNVGVSTA